MRSQGTVSEQVISYSLVFFTAMASFFLFFRKFKVAGKPPRNLHPRNTPSCIRTLTTGDTWWCVSWDGSSCVMYVSMYGSIVC